jgi:transposase
MKRKRFTEEQIIAALKEVDGGGEARDVCRRLGVTGQSFCGCAGSRMTASAAALATASTSSSVYEDR